MKKWIKSTMALITAAIMLCAMGPTTLASGNTAKDETVYALLETDGTVKNIYVVNTFEMDAGGKITDYGAYSEVRNLTTTDSLQQNGDEVSVNAPAGWFYYEGKLENASLPWVISIRYFLNGKEVPASDVAGADGDMQIKIDVRPNESAGSNFADHYMLQVSLSLNTDRCRDIVAQGATITSSGSEKKIVFTVLPGNEAELAVGATVDDFELDSIQIAGVAMGMDIDIDSSELTEGTDALSDGAQELKDGAAELYNGAGAYNESIATLAYKMEELNNASANVQSGLTQMADALSELSGSSDDLTAGLAQLQSGLEQYASGLNQLQTQFTALGDGSAQLYASFTQAVTGMSNIMTNAETLKVRAEALQSSNDPQIAAFAQGYLALYDALDNFSAGLNELETQYATVNAGITQMTKAIEGLSAGLTDVQTGLAAFAEGFSKQSAALSEISEGLNALASSYSGMDNGTSQLASSAAQLAASYEGIYDGISTLQTGIEELGDGIDTLDSKINDKIDELVSDLSNEDYRPDSFASAKNTNINSVQFVLMTDPIQIEQVEPEEETEEPKTFWQRLMALFT